MLYADMLESFIARFDAQVVFEKDYDPERPTNGRRLYHSMGVVKEDTMILAFIHNRTAKYSFNKPCSDVSFIKAFKQLVQQKIKELHNGK